MFPWAKSGLQFVRSFLISMDVRENELDLCLRPTCAVIICVVQYIKRAEKKLVFYRCIKTRLISAELTRGCVGH